MKTTSSISKPIYKKLSIKIISLLMLLGTHSATHAEDLFTRLKKARQDSHYLPSNSQEVQQSIVLFSQELKSEQVDWQSLHIQRLSLGNAIVLQEENNYKTGRGIYAIKAEGKPYLLQAPHSDSDLYTGQIVAKLFAEYSFRAAAWNTVSRKEVDMAHLSQSYFQGLTQAFVQAIPNGRIMQLHGFEQNKRKTEDGKNTDMIISAGTKNTPEWVKKIADCFKQSFSSYQVKLYPNDIHELGAIENAQNNLLQSLQYQGFLHIEMSKSLRETLVKDPVLRQQFNACLF